MPTIKEMVEVMQAYEAGSKIECTDKYDMPYQWRHTSGPDWDWSNYIYRVKPEPRRLFVLTYRLWLDGPEYSRGFASEAAAEEYLSVNGGARSGITSRVWMVEER